MKKLYLPMLAGGLALLGMGDGFAASASGNLAVSAIVNAQCVVQSAALPFGTYNSTAVQQNAQIGVTCSNGTAYTVSLDAGTGSGASTASRKLVNADGSGTALNYGLYQDSSRTKAWGSANGTDTLSGVGTGATQSIPVYGQIPGGQTAVSGNYSDVVAITLSY